MSTRPVPDSEKPADLTVVQLNAFTQAIAHLLPGDFKTNWRTLVEAQDLMRRRHYAAAEAVLAAAFSSELPPAPARDIPSGSNTLSHDRS